VGKGGSVDQISGTLLGGFVDVDGKIPVLARDALRLLRARPAMLAASAIGVGSIPDIQTDKVRCSPAEP
jgi:hypothetical protein